MSFLREQPPRCDNAERLRCHCGIVYGGVVTGQRGRGKILCWLIGRYYTPEKTPGIRETVLAEPKRMEGTP